MLELLQSFVPFPFAYLETLHNSNLLPQSRFCRKCQNKDCTREHGEEFRFECANGFTCFPMVFGEAKFTINGLITPESTTKFDSKRRKAYKKYKVSPEDIDLLQSSLSEINGYIARTANEQVKDSVAFLHDIRTSVGIVLSWCQELISKQQGASFEEQLNKVDQETANLFTSINLLQEQLDLADIIANPTSVTYGKKHRSSIHGFIFKMVKLFEPRAAKRGINIWMYGKTDAIIEAYNSFQFIPLILLDNAVKYSFPNHEIKVELTEKGNVITLKVTSYGKLVPEAYRDKIFDKYVRGPRAIKQDHHGMGLGLYIARTIAKAHNTDILYKAVVQSEENVGYNHFIIKVQKVE